MRDLSRGDRGKEVLDVQTRLRGQGFELGREGVDGFFGPHTQGAVLSFQQERGLLADARVGANTWRELVEAGYRSATACCTCVSRRFAATTCCSCRSS